MLKTCEKYGSADEMLLHNYNTNDPKKLRILEELVRCARIGNLQDAIFAMNGGINCPMDYVGGQLNSDCPEDWEDIQTAFRRGVLIARVKVINILFDRMKDEGGADACFAYLDMVGWEPCQNI
jgi:hypothetical protein